MLRHLGPLPWSQPSLGRPSPRSMTPRPPLNFKVFQSFGTGIDRVRPSPFSCAIPSCTSRSLGAQFLPRWSVAGGLYSSPILLCPSQPLNTHCPSHAPHAPPHLRLFTIFAPLR